jgi:hypothetical protein
MRIWIGQIVAGGCFTRRDQGYGDDILLAEKAEKEVGASVVIGDADGQGIGEVKSQKTCTRRQLRVAAS